MEINYIDYDENHIVNPDTSNEIRFHGTLEELKKYLPEFVEKSDFFKSYLLERINIENSKKDE